MKLILILLIVAFVVLATDAANEKGPHPPHAGHKPGDHPGLKPKRAAPPPLEEGYNSEARVKRHQHSSEEGGSTHHPKADSEGKQKRATLTL
uniref:Secreted protein n=1 Tax=Haemonchus contortus TaxID=6289 RepID=A0A7I4YC79_HAECO